MGQNESQVDSVPILLPIPTTVFDGPVSVLPSFPSRRMVSRGMDRYGLPLVLERTRSHIRQMGSHGRILYRAMPFLQVVMRLRGMGNCGSPLVKEPTPLLILPMVSLGLRFLLPSLVRRVTGWPGPALSGLRSVREQIPSLILPMGPIGPVSVPPFLAYLETVFAGTVHDGSRSARVALIRLLILPTEPHGQDSVKQSFPRPATACVGPVHDSSPSETAL